MVPRYQGNNTKKQVHSAGSKFEPHSAREHSDRQTDKQTDRQTHRQAESRSKRERERESETEKEREREIEIERDRERERDRDTEREKERTRKEERKGKRKNSKEKKKHEKERGLFFWPPERGEGKGGRCPPSPPPFPGAKKKRAVCRSTVLRKDVFSDGLISPSEK